MKSVLGFLSATAMTIVMAVCLAPINLLVIPGAIALWSAFQLVKANR